MQFCNGENNVNSGNNCDVVARIGCYFIFMLSKRFRVLRKFKIAHQNQNSLYVSLKSPLFSVRRFGIGYNCLNRRENECR